MSKTLKKIDSYTVGKTLVKMTGVRLLPEMVQQSDGRFTVDESKPVIKVTEQGGHNIGRARLQFDLTGTQKLNIFGEKEAGDSRVTVYVTIWDKFQIEIAKKLSYKEPVDVLLTDCIKNDKGYYVATCYSMQQAVTAVAKPWQVSWSRTIRVEDEGKLIIETPVKFRRPMVKDSDGNWVKSESEPYFRVKQFDNGVEFANVQTQIQLHKKTAQTVFGEADERLAGATGSHVVYFPQLTAVGKVLKQLTGLKDQLDKTFFADMILEKNDKYYNGMLLSVSFMTAKEKDEAEKTEEPTTEETKADGVDFPDLSAVNATVDFPEMTEEPEAEVPFSETEEEKCSDEPLADFPDALGM